MDLSMFELTLFLGGTFVAAVVAGLAGFAFGLAAAAIWLYALSPLQTAALIVGFGLVVQGYSVWKLRAALRWNRLWPFLIGAALGVPLGIAILGWAKPGEMRTGIGVVLVLYALYGLTRPTLPQVRGGGSAADGGIGFLSGIVGGATGLAGILAVIWCGLRGWSKDEQRAVFQPVAVAIFLLTAAWLGGSGKLSLDTLYLFALGLPVLLIGTWLGLRLYGRLDEAGFRKVVLVLLLVSGIALVL